MNYNSLIQVFRLAQLIIQYLVHCQQQLTDQLAAKEEQRKKVIEEKEKAASFATALEEEVKALRKENKKLEVRMKCMENLCKMMREAYVEMLRSGGGVKRPAEDQNSSGSKKMKL